MDLENDEIELIQKHRQEKEQKKAAEEQKEVQKDAQFPVSKREKEIIDVAQKLQLDIEEKFAEEKKKAGNIQRVLEALLFGGVVGISIFAILLAIIMLYFAITGFKLEWALWFLLGGLGILFVMNILQFIMIKVSGDWFKIGWDLFRNKGSCYLKFTKSGRLVKAVEPVMPWNFFKAKDKRTRFLTVKKGYIDTSTGKTVYTVREDAPTDFDVNEEYKTDLEEFSPQISNKIEQTWDAGVFWNNIDWPKLQMLLILAMCISGLGVLVGGAGLYSSYTSGEKLTKDIRSLDGNFAVKISNIEKRLSQLDFNKLEPGVIVEGRK